MGSTLSQQLQQFLLSCGLGFLLGLYYEVYRVPRLVMRSGGRAVFLQDVAFCLTSAVITFLFALAVTDGRLRFYLFLGEGIGFFCYFFTVGRLVRRFAVLAVRVFLRGWNILWSVLLAPFRFFWSRISPLFQKMRQFLKNWAVKQAGKLKILLHKPHKVLYNQKKASETAQHAPSAAAYEAYAAYTGYTGKRRSHVHEGRRKKTQKKKKPFS